MSLCPCGSHADYNHCCGPFHQKIKKPLTAEALMLSRYSAYALADMEYIEATMTGKASLGFNKNEARQWAEHVEWIGLNVVKEKTDTSEQDRVEFIAYYLENNKLKSIHEVSQFNRVNNNWLYTDAIQSQNKTHNIPRNSACPCGSQKKFKNCHGKNN